MRIDQFLALRIEEHSRASLRKIVEIGGVRSENRRVRRCSQPVRSGQLVEVHIDGLPLTPFSLSEEHVLFRDGDILAVVKPAGVDSQPTPARYKGTLYEALLRYLHNPFRPRERPELAMVQRLDRDTSGVMVFSIARRAHKALSRIFSDRQAEKLYLALVAGVPSEPEGEIRSLLARNRATNLMRSVERGGREAITRYKVIECFDGASLVEVRILTGRSHQIRVHFSEAGHPLLGDRRYGGPGECKGGRLERQMLHAWRLLLPHPVTGKPLDLQAELPEDMEKMLRLLRGGGDAAERPVSQAD